MIYLRKVGNDKFEVINIFRPEETQSLHNKNRTDAESNSEDDVQ